MSILSDFLDTLIERLEEVFPQGEGYFLLSHQNEIEKNIDPKLYAGYSFKLGEGSRPEIEQIGQTIEIVRKIIIVQTRKSIAVETDRKQFYKAEKQLLEDQRKLLKDIIENWALYAAEDNRITAFQYSGDNGVELVFPEREDFIKIESTFNLEYEEELGEAQ